MTEIKQIKYVPHDDIDFHRWDRCINTSINELVYAYSWYLDSVTDRWDALVADNYAAVMPLPLYHVRGRWILKTVSLIPQLGVFSVLPVTTQILKQFIDQIPGKFKSWNLPLNVLNPRDVTGLKITSQSVFSKDLIYDSKTQQTIANSSEITEQGEAMSVNRGVQLAVIINFILRIQGNKVKDVELLALRRLLSFSSRFGFGNAYGAYSSANNLIGLTYVIRFHNRAYMLFSVAEQGPGRKKIFQLLLNRIYNDFEQQDLVLESNDMEDPDFRELLHRNGFCATPYISIVKRRKLLGII